MPDNKRQRREQITLQYLAALDTGDLETVALILRLAETDTELERMLMEVHHELESEGFLQPLLVSPNGRVHTPDPLVSEPPRQRRDRSEWAVGFAALAALALGLSVLVWTNIPAQFGQVDSATATPQPTPVTGEVIIPGNVEHLIPTSFVGEGGLNPLATWIDAGLVTVRQTDISLSMGPRADRGFRNSETTDGYVTAFDITADGKWLLAGQRDGGAALYDVLRQEQVWTLAASGTPVQRVGLREDGNQFVIWDGESVQVYEPKSDRPLETLAADGLLAMTYASDGDFRLLSAAGWFTRGENGFEGSAENLPEPLDRVTISEDGLTAVGVTGSGALLRWREADGWQPLEFGLFAPTQLALNPNGTVLAVADDRSVLSFNLETRAPNPMIISQSLVTVALNPAGDTVAIVGRDGLVQLVRLEDGSEVATFGQRELEFESVALQPGGDLAALSSWRGVTIYNRQTGERQAHYQTLWQMGLAWSPDGRLLAGLTNEGIDLLDPLTGEIVRSLAFSGDFDTDVPGDGGDLRTDALDWSPDGQRIAAGRIDGTIWVWDAASGEVLQRMATHEAVMTALRFSPDGRQIAAVSMDMLRPERAISIWDAASGEQLQSLPLLRPNARGLRLAYSPDGRWLAATMGDMIGELVVYDTRTWEIVFTDPLQNGLNALGLSFNPASTLLAVSDGSQAVQMLTVGRWEVNWLLDNSSTFTDLAFDSSGTTLALVNGKGFIQFWQIEE